MKTTQQAPAHFKPPQALLGWVANRGWQLEMPHSRHWLFRLMGSTAVMAQYWPGDARLHIHEGGNSVPTAKYPHVAPADVQAILHQHWPTPAKVGHALPEPADEILPAYAAEDAEHTLSMHEQLQAVPREEIPRRELKWRQRVRLLTQITAALCANHRLFPADRDGGFKVEELVDKAESILAAIEARAEKGNVADIEELHGK